MGRDEKEGDMRRDTERGEEEGMSRDADIREERKQQHVKHFFLISAALRDELGS